VGIVLNFEARGSGGPVIMFETSDENGQLIKEFAAASPSPVANSLSYEIYKRLPNDTDLTIFKRAGIPGLNFAYIRGFTHYHTAADNLNHVSERSLQHQGSYALSLTRHFGSLNLTVDKKSNAIYFNLLGSILVHYPGALIIPLAVLSLLLYVGLVVVSFRRGQLTAKGIALGALTLLVSSVFAWLTVSLIWRLVRSLHKGYESSPWGVPYNSGYYEVALILLTISIVAVAYGWFRRKLSMADMWVGAQLWWILLAVTVSILVPGGSYLLVWPLLCALAATKLYFAPKGRKSAKQIVALAICAAPTVLLFSPMIYHIFAALTLNAAGVIAVLLVLLCGLLTPYLELLTGSRKWAFPGVTGLLSLILIMIGLLTADFAPDRPKVNHVFYCLNTDTGQALWGSADKAPDEWTAQFFPQGGERGKMTEFVPMASRSFITSTAPAAQLPAPEVVLLDDSRNTPTRAIRLRVKSPRKAPILSIYARADGELLTASVNGREVPTETDHGKLWGLRYYAFPEEGVELSFRMRASGPVEVRVDDCSYGLPDGAPVKKRPAYMMASPSPNSDVTLVGKSFKF
jgi:Peptidase family M28